MEKLTKLLHHRAPYLLIDEVIAIDEKSVLTKTQFTLEKFPFLHGHFPGAHILPGAMMQEMTTQSAGYLMTAYYSPVEDYDSEKTKGFAIGVLSKIYHAKFLGVVKPGSIIETSVKLIDHQDRYFVFEGTVQANNKIVLKNKFALSIIPDDIILDH